MSLITRCPACGTMFKVVTDQLKVSQGWVRCGQCAEVFEAPEHMQAATRRAAAVEAAVTARQSSAPSALPVPPQPTPPHPLPSPSSGAAELPSPDASAKALNAANAANAAEAAQQDVPHFPAAPPADTARWAPALTFADQHPILPGKHLAPARGGDIKSDFDPERWQQEHQARIQQQAQASGAALNPSSLPASPRPHRSPVLAPAGTPLPVTAPQHPAAPSLRPLFTLPNSAPSAFPVALPEARPYGFTKAKKAPSHSAFDQFAAPDPRDIWEPSPAPPSSQERQGPSDPAAEPSDLCDAQEVSFVRQAQRQAFWRRPAMRVLSGLVAFMLSGLLTLQWGLQNRDALAARSPQWSAWVMAVCAPLKCSVRAPRNIEQVVIDNSGFKQLAPDVYQLSVTLKNHSPVAVQIPALEVTLTDTADHAVLRRVVLPADFVPNLPPRMAPTLAASGELQGLVHITLLAWPKGEENNSETPASAGSWRVAGYRLLAFYPD